MQALVWVQKTPSLGSSEGLPYPLNSNYSCRQNICSSTKEEHFCCCLASWVITEQHVQLLTVSIIPNCPNIPLAEVLDPGPTILRMFYGMGNAKKKVLNLNTICKTSSPNTSANKWIHQCSCSIMGAICVLFSENNAFCKITLNRKCLCCHFWLLTASSQWDLPQHRTDLAVFADWGLLSPIHKTAMEILMFIFFYLIFSIWHKWWVFLIRCFHNNYQLPSGKAF